MATGAAATICVRDGQEIGSGRIDGDTVGGRASAPQISGTGYRCGAELCGLPLADGIAASDDTNW